MGAVLGKQMEKAMDENMKKQQDFMLSSQKMQVRSCGVEVSGFYFGQSVGCMISFSCGVNTIAVFPD